MIVSGLRGTNTMGLTPSPPPPKRLSKVDGHWLWVGGPVPPGSAGITLGSVVIIRKAAARDGGFADLLAHEQVHVRQFAELGVGRFLARYLKSYARFRLYGYGHWQAYSRIPLEVEARVDGRAHRNSSSGTSTPIGLSESPMSVVDLAGV